MIEEGKPAPDFELATDTGERVKLSDYRGQPVVLYFYPKDDTPGCTVEACGFRDSYTDFEKRGAVVLGVSPDDVGLPREVQEQVLASVPTAGRPGARGGGAIRRVGREEVRRQDLRGVKRSTFVIDADGNVAKVMHNVKPDGHPEQVLAALPS